MSSYERDDSISWRTCGGDAHSIRTRCARIDIKATEKSLLKSVVDKLHAIWKVDTKYVSDEDGLSVEAIWYPPGVNGTRAHLDYHHDGRLFEVSNVIYLTSVPNGTARTRFTSSPEIAVQPTPGQLATWLNYDADRRTLSTAAWHFSEALPASK